MWMSFVSTIDLWTSALTDVSAEELDLVHAARSGRDVVPPSQSATHPRFGLLFRLPLARKAEARKSHYEQARLELPHT